MAENTAAETTPPPAEEPGVTPAPDAPENEAPAQDDDPRGNREAAKYRKQLRDAEQQRDTLRTQLTASRISVLASSKELSSSGMHPEAHIEAFAEPDSFFTDDGQINKAAVQARLAELRKEKPYLFTRMIIPNEGKAPANSGNSDAFETAFKPPVRS